MPTKKKQQEPAPPEISEPAYVVVHIAEDDTVEGELIEKNLFHVVLRNIHLEYIEIPLSAVKYIRCDRNIFITPEGSPTEFWEMLGLETSGED